jgi:putative hydrolase of the HAD superfamily
MLDLHRFRAVIFDFDGVIVDSESMQVRSWKQVAQAIGRDCNVSLQQIAGRLDRELAGAMFPGCDADSCVREKAMIEQEMETRGELQSVAGVAQFLRSILATHRLAIASSCHRDVLNRRLTMLGLRNLFEVVVGRSDVLRHKPAPDLYLRALDDLALHATDACAIEDSPTGIDAAKAAGLYTIQLLHLGMPRVANADEVITRFPT